MSNKSLLSSSAIYIVGGILPQAINFLLIPIFTRFLTPEEVGIFSYTTIFSLFYFIIGTFSIHSYLLRHYYDCKGEGDKKELVGTTFLFLTCLNFILLVLFHLYLPKLITQFNISVPFKPYIQLMLFATSIEILATIPLSIYRVREEAFKFIILTSMFVILNALITTYLIVVKDMGIMGRYWGQLSANSLMLLAYLVIIIKNSKISFNRGLIKTSMAFCLPLIPAQLFLSLRSIADKVLIERFLDLSQLGIYSIGFALAYVVQLIGKGIYRAVEPRIYQYESLGILENYILKFKFYIVLTLGIIGGGIAGMAPEIVQIFIGPKFQESYKIIPLFVIAMTFQSLCLFPSTFLMAKKKTYYEPFIRFGGILVSVLLLAYLIPKLGIIGAGIAAIISSLIVLLGYVFVVNKISSFDWFFSRDILILVFLFGINMLFWKIELKSIMFSLILKSLIVSVVSLTILFKSRSLEMKSIEENKECLLSQSS